MFGTSESEDENDGERCRASWPDSNTSSSNKDCVGAGEDERASVL